MKCFAYALVLASALAFGDSGPASCQVSEKSVVSRSPSGIAQVSNLGLIGINCGVAARPWSRKPGTFRRALKAGVTVYEVSADNTRSEIPSEVNVSGGGSGDGKEWVEFYVDIPLGPSERDAEVRRFLAGFEGWVDEHPQDRQELDELVRDLRTADPQELAAVVSQYRVGNFRVDCRVLDDDRIIGMGGVDLEVLFKGHFADQYSDTGSGKQ